MSFDSDKARSIFLTLVMTLSLFAIAPVGLTGTVSGCGDEVGGSCPGGEEPNDGEAGDDGMIYYSGAPSDTVEGQEFLVYVIALDNDGDRLGSGIEIDVSAERWDWDSDTNEGEWLNEPIEGTTLVSTDSEGEAWFTDLTINQPGTYRLNFTTNQDTGWDLGYRYSEHDEDGVFTTGFEVEEQQLTDFDITTQPINTTAGDNIQGHPTVTITDQEENGVEGEEVTVELIGGHGDGIVSGDTEVQTDENGDAEFDDLVIEDTFVDYQLEFDHTDFDPLTSDEYWVKPDDPDQISVTTQPETTTVGESIGGPPEVQVLDQYDNTVWEGDVTVSEMGSQTVEGTTTEQLDGFGGTVEFDDITIGEVGEYGLTFEIDTISVNSDNFNMIGANSVAVETQPEDTDAGQEIGGPPIASVTDSDSEPMEGVEVTVEEDGGETIDGTLTKETNSLGEATFDDLSIDEPGSYELEFSIDEEDGNVEDGDSITSDPFDVEALVDDVTPRIGGDQSPDVNVHEEVDIDVQVSSDGDDAENVDVNVEEITDPTEVDVNNLDGRTINTEDDGVATFDDVEFTGDAGEQFTIDFEAEGEIGTLTVTTQPGDPTDVSIDIANPSDEIATVGESIEYTIKVQDDSDNDIEGADVTPITPSEVDATPSSTETTDGQGEVDFSVSAPTDADDYEITFEGSEDSTSTTATFEPDDATELVITQDPPNEVDAGETFEVRAEPHDQHGNLDDDWGDEAYIAIDTDPSDGDATLGGNTDVITQDGDGILIFDELEIDVVEDGYTLEVTDDADGLTPDQTTAFDVTPDEPDDISIEYQPDDTDADDAIGGVGATYPAVNVTDEFGNGVPGEEVTVSEVGNNVNFDESQEPYETDDDGIATFDGLQIHDADEGYQLEFSVSNVSEEPTSDPFEIRPADPASVTPSIDGESEPDVPVDIEQNIDVLVEDQYGNEVTGEDVGVDNIHTTGQTEVENLNEDSVQNTESDGEVTFQDVIFTGDAPEDATITFNADGEDGDLVVNVQVGEVDTVTPRIDDEQDPTVAVGAANDVVVTVRDTSENLVEDEEVRVQSITEDSGIDEINGIDDTSTADTGSDGNATFGDVEFIGEDGAEASITFENDTGDVAGTITVTLETGDADSIVVETEPEDGVAGETIEGYPTVTVTDAGGNPVEDVSVEASETQESLASLDGTTTVPTINTGVAVFDDTNIKSAYSDLQLRFSIDSSDENVMESDEADSELFDIEPANATSVSLLNEPVETVAGNPINATDPGLTAVEPPAYAEVRDEYGNTVPNVEVTVEEEGGYEFDSGAETTTESSNSAGWATFGDLVIETADTDYHLNFSIDESTDNVKSSDSVVSDPFDIVPAEPDHFTYSQPPTDETAGEPMRPNITLELQDEFGNFVPDASAAVDLWVLDDEFAQHLLVERTATEGTVKFPELTIESAGTYIAVGGPDGFEPIPTLDPIEPIEPIDPVLAEEEDPLSSTAHEEFDITSAAPTNLTILTQPGDTVAGQTIAGPPTVQIEDDYGNLVKNETIEVSVPDGTIDAGQTSVATDENGTATFDDLEIRETGTYELYFDVVDYETNGTSEEFTIEHAGIHSVTPTINANPTPTVTARVPQTVAVSVQDEFENPIPGEQVSFDALDTGEDEFNVTGLDAGNSTATTTERGEALFSNVIFNGTESQTVDLTFSTATTSGTMDVTLEEPIEGFVVEISHTNSPVQVADSLTVTAGIVNTDDEQHTQSVEFTVGPFSDSETISLEPDESTQTTFTWNVGPADRGSHLAEVSSEDDADNTTVTVFADPPAFESGHVPEDAPESVFATFDDDVFIHEDADETAGFSVTADGSAVEVAGASTDGHELELTLAESIEYEQSVVFGYDGDSGTLVNEHGVEAEAFEAVELENRVPEPLEANLSALDPETGERTDRLSVDVTMEQGVIFSAADSLLPTGAEVTYEWQIGDETFTTDEPELSEEFLEPGIYNATLSIFADDRTSSAEFSLEVVDETPPDVQLSALDSVNVGDDPELDASESTDNVAIAEYQWDFGDGETTSGAELTNPEHAFDEAGEYEVTVTVVDTSGNTESETVTVEVEESGGVADVNPAPVGAFLLFAAVIGGVYYYYRRFH